MAGMTATCIIKYLAICKVCHMLRQSIGGQWTGNRDHPKGSKAQRCEQRQARNVTLGEKLGNDLFLRLAE